jgi:cobalamin biosynthesis Mg chelatase CobN
MQDEPTPPKAITKPVMPTSPGPTPKKDGDNNWPDPLDFHDFADNKDKEDTEPKEAAPTMEQKQPSSDALLDEAAVSTPFVKTKVEKRPLGAYADATPPAPEEPKEENGDKPEIVSVTDQAPSKGEMAAASIQSNQHMDKPDDSETDMNQLRSMSIPQQYHAAEQKQSGEVHNLFDTKEYHAAPQQIVHPAKKGGSAWFVIMVIVLIVLLVAAVTVGYFMMTGTLDLSKIF